MPSPSCRQFSRAVGSTSTYFVKSAVLARASSSLSGTIRIKPTTCGMTLAAAIHSVQCYRVRFPLGSPAPPPTLPCMNSCHSILQHRCQLQFSILREAPARLFNTLNQSFRASYDHQKPQHHQSSQIAIPTEAFDTQETDHLRGSCPKEPKLQTQWSDWLRLRKLDSSMNENHIIPATSRAD